jgi:hypothetical protein
MAPLHPELEDVPEDQNRQMMISRILKLINATRILPDRGISVVRLNSFSSAGKDQRDRQ